MSPSQAFPAPVLERLGDWTVRTRDLLKSIEESGIIVNGAGPDSVSAALAFAAIEITHGMLVMIGVGTGHAVAELRETLPAPPGWPDAS